MAAKDISLMTRNKDILRVFAVTTGLLLIPLLGNWSWTVADFLVMGIVLSGTGLLIVLASRKIKSFDHRMAVIVTILIAFLLIWAELGVGVFGSPFAGS